MAKLSAHGKELARLEFPNHRTAYMEDGNILRNFGSGWKLYRKFRPEVNVAAKVVEVLQKYNARPEEFHALMGALETTVSLEHRGKLWVLLGMMDTDPDGMWAMLGDYGCDVDYEDISRVADLYRAWLRVHKAAAQPCTEK